MENRRPITLQERLSFRNEFRSRMKFVLNSHIKAFSRAPDQIRMRHSPQTRRFAIFNSERSSLSVYMMPEWSLIPEREFRWDWKPEWPVREQNVVSVSCKQIQRNMWRWNELVPELSGFVQISGSKIQDFFQNNNFFPDSRLSNRSSIETLKKRRNKAFTTMRCKRTGEIEYDLTNTKKISLEKHLL